MDSLVPGRGSNAEREALFAVASGNVGDPAGAVRTAAGLRQEAGRQAGRPFWGLAWGLCRVSVARTTSDARSACICRKEPQSASFRVRMNRAWLAAWRGRRDRCHNALCLCVPPFVLCRSRTVVPAVRVLRGRCQSLSSSLNVRGLLLPLSRTLVGFCAPLPFASLILGLGCNLSLGHLPTQPLQTV